MKLFVFALLLAAPVGAAPDIVLQTPPRRAISTLEVLPDGKIAASGEDELNIFSASLEKWAAIQGGIADAPLAFSRDGKRALFGGLRAAFRQTEIEL